MKTFLLRSVLFLAFAGTTTAQITITQTDMPQPGDMLRTSITSDSTGLPSSILTGAGITWNYSALVAQSQTVDTFLNVSTTPLTYQLYFNDAILYPNYKSTVAQAGANLPPLGPLTISAVVNYYKAQAANYESVGYGAEIDAIPTSVKDDNIDIVYTFPMNYGNADSCRSASHVSIPYLGYYGQKQYRINHVEGWGTLITPFGIFSTLKVKTIIYSSDSLYIDTLHLGFATPQTEQIQYKWLANGQHIPVLQINETPGSKTKQYIYRDSTRHIALGVADMNPVSNEIVVYPNPSKGELAIGISDKEQGISEMQLKVYNILGEQVYSAPLPQTPVRTGTGGPKGALNEINLSNQPGGVYLYRVITTTGQLIGEGKLIIQK